MILPGIDARVLNTHKNRILTNLLRQTDELNERLSALEAKQEQEPEPTPEEADTYTINPGDTLTVTVTNKPEPKHTCGDCNRSRWGLLDGNFYCINWLGCVRPMEPTHSACTAWEARQ